MSTTPKTTGEMFAAIDRAFKREITAPKAYAAHQAYKAEIAEIGRQQAEAIKTAPGYSAKLGCFVSAAAEVAFLNDQLASARQGAEALKMAAE
ncbi:hypothetical protein [Caulobacter segnis]|nr:hypothetical protein [Caulobacter segnis]